MCDLANGDSNINKVFDLGGGCVITIKERHETYHYKSPRYLCVCETCSKDVEVFPYGSIVCNINNIKRGFIPCGCSKKPTLSEKQDLILFNRELKNRKSSYTVIERIQPEKGSRYYVLECDICSKDKELWYYGSIVSKKSHILNSDQKPCGCSQSVRWSETQYEILVKRQCALLGYDFLGWNGDFNGGRTKIKLHNPYTNNVWDTTLITSFINCGHKDPSLAGRLTGDPVKDNNADYIHKFMSTGKFKEGTVFKRNLIKTNHKGSFVYWDYICPKCSNDEYVKAGICNGVFTSTGSRLQKGHLACRCSDKYRFTKEQREYQIKKTCRERGFTFIDWLDDKRYTYKNDLGVKQIGRIKNTASGLDGDTEDYLYIVKIDNYLKVGRSIHPRIRFSELARASKSRVTLLRLYKGTHDIVKACERTVHKELYNQGYYFESGWTIESFKIECLAKVISLLKDFNIEEVT